MKPRTQENGDERVKRHSIEKNNMWVLVDLSYGAKPIGLK